MRATRRLIVISLVIFGAGALAVVASADPRAPGYPKAFACSACHGFDGNSRANTTPVLAGMAPWYFKKAVQDYASGRRPAAEMEPFAKLVQELGVDDVAAYFAARTREPSPLQPDPSAVARGSAAAAVCVVCHGSAGQGDPARGVPTIAGQPAGYLRIQLRKFKTEVRSPGEPNLVAMKALFRTISDEVLDDVAAYYASLR
jgi:cytochrome c553